ncbi:MAG: hypothetical protein KDA65_03220 [Planctomycetaceae bacterium]|nr:hypothetical protein [Planctomycetaceae bacterium]
MGWIRVKGGDQCCMALLYFARQADQYLNEFDVPVVLHDFADQLNVNTAVELLQEEAVIATGTVLSEINDPDATFLNHYLKLFLKHKGGYCDLMFLDGDADRIKSCLLKQISLVWQDPIIVETNSVSFPFRDISSENIPSFTDDPGEFDILVASGPPFIKPDFGPTQHRSVLCFVIQKPQKVSFTTELFESYPPFFGSMYQGYGKIHFRSSRLTPVWFFRPDWSFQIDDSKQQRASYIRQIINACSELYSASPTLGKNNLDKG